MGSSLAGAVSPSAKNCSDCHCTSDRELYSICRELVPAERALCRFQLLSLLSGLLYERGSAFNLCVRRLLK